MRHETMAALDAVSAQNRPFLSAITRLEHAHEVANIMPRRDVTPGQYIHQALASSDIAAFVNALQLTMPGDAGDRLALALFASQMSGAEFGRTLHSGGSIIFESARGELCTDTESRTREALDPSRDGLLIGMSREGQPMMAVKVFPGRATAAFFQPVALDQGVAIPGVWYEIDDDDTRRDIKRQSAAGNPCLELSSKTRFVLTRAIRDGELPDLTSQLMAYQARVLATNRLQPQVVDPFNPNEFLPRDVARQMYELRAPDDW